MRVIADRETCQGYGNCTLTAADVFDVDEQGLVVLRTEEVPAGTEADVRQAVRECPVGALAVEG